MICYQRFSLINQHPSSKTSAILSLKGQLVQAMERRALRGRASR